MRRTHFEAFAPVCPVCRRGGAEPTSLVLVAILAEDAHGIIAGRLQCQHPVRPHEFPIVDGIPLIVPDVGRLLTDRGVELLLRADLDQATESLIGDALGPDSWFDAIRQMQSTYGWDAYGDAQHPGETEPGAADRCLRRLLALAGPAPKGRTLDIGCGAGRTSFTLAEHRPDALVLGIDMNLALLRIAAAAARGRVSFPVRRIGVVYDRCDIQLSLAGAERVDFWAADALALPFPAGGTAAAAALNLLDCVADPMTLLRELAAVVAPAGHILLATPFDWATRATPITGWIGGHSQRAAHGGGAEALLRDLVTEGAHPQSPSGLRIIAEEQGWPWHTRLHARARVQYQTYLLALQKADRPTNRHPEDGEGSALDKLGQVPGSRL